MKIIKSSLFWRICWLIGFDYSFILLNQYLLIYFIKIVIFYLTILSIFDYQIRTIFELFSYETFWFIFSEDGLFFIIILLILILISYGISTIILKYINYKNISNLSKELKK